MNAQHAQRRNREFNPAIDLFKAQDQRPANLQDIDLEDQSPLLRALLVIDGTVTTFLEAYALEPIEIQRISQESLSLMADNPWLEAGAGAPVVSRKVMLLGCETGRLYAWAESLIVQDRLCSPIQKGLEQEPGGLGRILVDSEIESRREGLWYGREQITDLPERVHSLCDGDFLTRTYRLIAGGTPLMMITERFPIPVGQAAAQVAVTG
jgi:chorismate-pyruvate lyase